MRRFVVALAALVWALSAQAAGAPFLWQVQGPKATHYLLGSVHLQPSGSGDLPAPIVEAYRQAQGLVFETDIGELRSAATQSQFASRGLAVDGGLRTEVGPELYRQTQGQLKKLGLSQTYCDRMRAWLCGMSVEIYQWRQAGFDGAEGIDERLYAAATHDGKNLRWFEKPAQHLGLFTDMPNAMAREFLASSLDDSQGDVDSPQALYRAWQHNDTAAIAKLVDEMRKGYPTIYERLLAGRNRAWMPTLTSFLDEPETQLIVVGAAHWVARDGLIAALRAKGYVVLPVTTLAPQQAAMADRTIMPLAR